MNNENENENETLGMDYIEPKCIVEYVVNNESENEFIYSENVDENEVKGVEYGNDNDNSIVNDQKYNSIVYRNISKSLKECKEIDNLINSSFIDEISMQNYELKLFRILDNLDNTVEFILKSEDSFHPLLNEIKEAIIKIKNKLEKTAKRKIIEITLAEIGTKSILHKPVNDGISYSVQPANCCVAAGGSNKIKKKFNLIFKIRTKK